MPAQKRNARRNYIDLVSDEVEPNSFAHEQAVSVPRLKAYLREMVMIILRARHDAR
jgi:hypothetical protein